MRIKKYLLCGLTLMLLTSCDFEEPYNSMPCKNSFEGMFRFCDTSFQKRCWGMTPKGFRAQGEYDSTIVDCSIWHIRLGIATCEQAIFDNEYIQKLSESVFNDPMNGNIEAIYFTLDECNLQNGQKHVEYKIFRDDIKKGIPPLIKNKEIKVLEKTGFTTNSLNTDTTGNFLIDFVPKNPDSIANVIWNENKNFSGIHIEVKDCQSSICKIIKYDYLMK